jgi:TolB-like protein/tetratricopeptide (TPR) repeat protein
MADERRTNWLAQLRERGVLRVALGYAGIALALLQAADIAFESYGLPDWAMRALIVAAVLGFPVALVLAWHFEFGDQGLTRDSAPPDAPRPRVHGVRRYADVLIIGVLLVAVAILTVRESDLGKPPRSEKPSLAVLPFENLSGDKAQSYFSDGLAEEVLDRLGQVPGLMVVARSSSFSFRDQGLDVRTIAERLGVATVLEGAVRREGRRLRLSAKLIDGKTGYQLWSGSFDREVTDVFAVQEELARAVIDAIVPVARGDANAAVDAAPPTTSLTAYDLFLLGRAAQTLRGPAGVVHLKKSVDHFEQALQLDPGFARAQGALANSLVLLMLYNEAGTADPERLRRAESAVYKALSLNPDSSEAQVAYANLLRSTQRAGAEDAYRRAIELNPNNAEAWHGYAVYLAVQPGRGEESDAANRRALELDPRSLVTWANYLGQVARVDRERLNEEMARAAVVFRDVPDALRGFVASAVMDGFPVEALRFSLAARASDGPVTVSPDQARFSVAFPWRNVDEDRVVREVEAALAANPALRKGPIMFLLVDAYGTRGDEPRLRELFEELVTNRGAENRDLNARMAFWYSVFGRYDEAARALALAEPIPEDPLSGGLGISINVFQAIPAKLRVLRATGREAEANELAQEYLAKWRDLRAQTRETGSFDWVDLAALAASEGHRDEAVGALRHAMAESDLPYLFRPTLPWFRNLEGHPGYDALVREREQRIERIRPEMLAMESAQAKETTP